MIRLIDWCDAVTEGLKDSALEDLQYIKDDVNNGRSQLWQIDKRGYCVTRIELPMKELVICCLEGKNVIDEAAEKFFTWADTNGYTVRVHTHRKSMVRYLERHHKFKQSETVLRRGVN